MNCSKTEELRKYLADELSAGESRLLERHVEDCLLCQRQMMEEEDSGEEFPSLHVPSALPTDFTAQVMTALEQVKLPKPKPNWKKRSVNILKKTALAVASVTAIITFGSMVSPTFASYVNSVIQSIQGIDQGMKQAAEKGYVQEINKKVTDQGITLVVKEVVADPARMAIIANIVDQNGKRIPFDPEKDAFSLTYKTKSGEDLNPGGGGYSYGQEGEYLVVSHDIFRFLKDSKSLPDEMIVGVEASMLNGKEGSWKVEFPVDMKKARAVANYTEIGQKYTTNGIEIVLQNMMTVPSTSMMEMEINWTKEREEQIQKWKEQNGWIVKEPKTGVFTEAERMERYFIDMGVAFQIFDEKGNVVAGWDDALHEELNQIRKNNVKHSYRGKVHDDGKGVTKWNGITPLIKDQSYKLKMHSLYLYEPSKFKATIPVDTLLKDKVTVTDSDSTYTLTGFTLKTTEEEEIIGNETYFGKGALISFSAILPEGIVDTSEWSAQDESKQKYNVSRNGTYKRGKDGRVHVEGTFFIRDLEKQPKELKLSHAIQQRQYQDLNWEVPFETSNNAKR
ncbi:DUF4179 domain-containing protein [Brevibacillus brevis]|uniref:DUF4179 domain-containing protein n=1 Tax=Brevibacillus brevis TaxID=1393 RepID=UPI000D0EE01B|nr:DUF4179 domain-containing protein [Brevibacillus brevis]PSJ70614.1 hypothetical protein C7J99_03620 [Brevibacillus brevis]RED30952.1 anti-sigma factor RsiW [Brevibacillus brevis]GEC90965.1 hypothetical protein BBR01nite_32960 [Brevibacillus brevis]VEF89834.1 Predicted transmembrane transcriptional regulator (anti-sigma factor) [Brevibacillus brevis]